MNARSFIACLCLTLVLPATAVEPPASPKMPAEMVRFYQHVNFIACFSTKEERVKAATASEKDSAAQPERLRLLSQVIREVQKATHEIDPQINSRVAAMAFFDLDQQANQVISCDGSEGTFTVTVRVTTVDPVTQMWLVKNYEQIKTGEMKDEFTRHTDHLHRQKGHTEVHTWRLMAGEWKRQEAPHVLLKLSK